ncbi:MAG: NAD(P)H-hydrate dehydratase [Burkholderia sp.]|nr:NAD(P)H-hydrate dehydratase [Burkholderia sp.]
MTAIVPPLRLYYHADPLLRIAELRTAEIAATETLPPHTLMKRAGTSISRWLLKKIDKANSSKLSKSEHRLVEKSSVVWFAIGPGNNGGDALVAAAELYQLGIPVEAWIPINIRHNDALWALSLAKSASIPISTEPPLSLEHYIWVVDGLFGIGLTEPLSDILAEIATRISTRTRNIGRVLSIDIPSGLNSDTGVIVGGKVAVKATNTLTFIASKPGLYMNDGRDLSGEIEVISLDVSIKNTISSIQLASPDLFSSALPERLFRSNKGTFGSLAIIGGDSGMYGAPILAARAALLAGTGKVHIGFVGKDTPLYDPLFPELMLHSAQLLRLDAMTAIVVGPGLGKHEEIISIIRDVVATNATVLFDADGLNIMVTHPDIASLVAQRIMSSTYVLTPHPLEAARLLDSTTATIQHDRLAAAQKLSTHFKSIVVLKGIGTVIASPDGRLTVNPTGNVVLATSGTGDTLSGLIGAFLAQSVSAYEAAIAAVYLHGLAADILVSNGIGPSGVTSNEVTTMVRNLLNKIIYFPSSREIFSKSKP